VVERRRDVPTVKSICSWPKRSHGSCGPAVGPDLPFRPMKRQVTSYLDNIRELPTVAQNNRLLPQTFTKNGCRSSSRYDSAIKPMIPQSREDGMHALHILRSDSESIGLQTCTLAHSSAALVASMQVCTIRALHTANVLLDMYLPIMAKVV
jgi:hypothetical protein